MKRKWLPIFLGLALASVAAAPQARAQSDQQQIVDGAVGVVQSFRNPGAYVDNVRALVRHARAIIIVPNMVKAGFIFGAQGGTGVLLAHNRHGWSYPAFYNMGAASFGFQAGVEVSKVVLIIMNDRALNLALQDAQLKLGADAGLAIATIGAGAEGSITAPSGADIYALSSSQGLFGGVALQGGVLGPAPDADAAYYGRPVTAAEIISGRGVRNPGANQLRAALAHS